MNDQTPDWNSVRDQINGLWPRWKPTAEERDLTVRRLSGLNQRWLQAAVESYRVSNGSTVFRVAELLEHYQRIANAGEARAARTTPPPESPSAKAREWQAERERDHAAALAFLRRQDRAEVGRAVSELRAAGWLGASPLPGRYEDWPVNACLIVQVRLEMGYTVFVAGGNAARHGMAQES